MRFLLFLLFAAAAIASPASEVASPKHASFQLDAKARRELVEKAVALKPGESYQSVTNNLGAPTSDQVLAKKENDRIVGRSLKYYAVRWDPSLVGEADELVDVFLDPQDRVLSVFIKMTIK